MMLVWFIPARAAGEVDPKSTGISRQPTECIMPVAAMFNDTFKLLVIVRDASLTCYSQNKKTKHRCFLMVHSYIIIDGLTT